MISALTLRTERVVRAGAPSARLLYASDLHFGWPWTRRVSGELLELVRATTPDALLLGGDLCDGGRAIEPLRALVRAASDNVPVLAVAGNHDVATGVERVRRAVIDGGGEWLHERAWEARGLRVEGRASERSAPSDGLRVLCAHSPRAIRKASTAGFDVVLAGHLHGGQLVLFERGGRLYPFAWLDRWNGPRFEVGTTTLIVSRGAGDALPLRWNCPREVVLCELASSTR